MKKIETKIEIEIDINLHMIIVGMIPKMAIITNSEMTIPKKKLKWMLLITNKIKVRNRIKLTCSQNKIKDY